MLLILSITIFLKSYSQLKNYYNGDTIQFCILMSEMSSYFPHSKANKVVYCMWESICAYLYFKCSYLYAILVLHLRGY